MRYLYAIILLCLLGLPCKAQEGIRFETIPFRQALDKARTEGKLVFIDCFTQTCAPCKRMARDIFPLKECGDYFNPRFISLAHDMEAGEGVEIAKKYNVRVYPTYLFINPDGTLLCSSTGATKTAKDFIDRVTKAIEQVSLDARYDKGERSSEFLLAYIRQLQKSPSTRLPKVVEEYLCPMTVAQLCQPEAWSIFSEEVKSTDSKLFQRLLSERKEFAAILGAQKVEQFILQRYFEEFRVYKRMGLDWDKRITALQTLEQEGYKSTLQLRYAMRFRQIIDKKQHEDVKEIIGTLKRIEKELPDEKERMYALEQLVRIERVANDKEKAAIAKQLKAIAKHITVEDYRNTLQRIMSRLTK